MDLSSVSRLDPVRRWRTSELAHRTGTPPGTFTRTILPDLVEAGVLVRRGRFWFGRAADIDSFLLGRWDAPTGLVLAGAR